MTHTDPETAAVEVWARMLCAADVHVYGADHPTWQQLVGESGSRIRDDYRKAAAWLLPRLSVSAGVTPSTDVAALRDRIAHALEREDAINAGYDHGFASRYGVDDETDGFVDAVLALLSGSVTRTDRAQCPNREPLLGVQCVKEAGHDVHSDRPGRIWYPVVPDRATVLDEAADVYDRVIADMGADVSKDPRYWAGVLHVVMGLRRLAGEARTTTPEAPHPPHDSWLVELRLDDGEWHVAFPTHDHAKAIDRLARRREENPGHVWRLVRETTSYALEPEPAASSAAGAPHTKEA